MLAILAMVVFFLRGRLSFLSEGIAEVRKADGWGVTFTYVRRSASLAAMAEVMRILLRAGKVRTRRRDVNATSAQRKFLVHLFSWRASVGDRPAISDHATVGRQPHFVLLAHRPVWGIGYGVVGSAGCDCHPVLGASFSLWSLVGTVAVMLLLSWLVYWAAHTPTSWLN